MSRINHYDYMYTLQESLKVPMSLQLIDESVR